MAMRTAWVLLAELVTLHPQWRTPFFETPWAHRPVWSEAGLWSPYCHRPLRSWSRERSLQGESGIDVNRV